VKIFFVRHGETTYNQEGKFQGQKDIPLDEAGKVQAEKLGLRFEDNYLHSGEQIAAIYSSPLSRAMDTADAVAEKLHITPKPDPTLKEMDMGEWEGKTAKQIMEQYKDENGVPLLKKWQENPVDNHIPGGEKVVELDARVATSLDKIIKNHLPAENIVLVTHMGPIAVALRHVLGKNLQDLGKIKTDNASVTVIEVEKDIDHGKVLVMNDTSHLKDSLPVKGKPLSTKPASPPASLLLNPRYI
jgi:broad specificity phosphatase PhoE